MRVVIALAAICALSQAALAQAPECKSISDPGARLACYDKVNSATASSTVAKSAMRAPPPRKMEAEKYIDSIGAEDALMNAQLKNICRGC